MNPVTVPLLATLFQVGGAVLGLPSAGVLVVFAVHKLRRWLATPVPPLGEAGGGDGLIGLIDGVTRFVHGVAGLVGAFADLVLTMAAFAAGIGLLLGGACWFTGRGLQLHAGWARWCGSALLVGAALLALVIALSLAGPGRVLMLALAVFCLLGVHTLAFGARPALG